MIVVTTENIPGFRVRQVLGPVFGLTVRSRGIGGNFAAGLRSITGGEVTAYVRLLEDARRQALDRLVQTATAMGANAITMMRYDSSEIGQTMSEIVAYGTAVVVDAAEGWGQQPVAAAQPAATPAIGPEGGQQPWAQQPAPQQGWAQAQPEPYPPYPAAPGAEQSPVAPPPPPPPAWSQQPQAPAGQPEPYPPYPPQQG